MTLLWKDPGPSRSAGMTDWKPIVTELERHPGEWAVVGEKSTRNAANATAHNLRLRYGLETRVRTADGVFYVYARRVQP